MSDPFAPQEPNPQQQAQPNPLEAFLQSQQPVVNQPIIPVVNQPQVPEGQQQFAPDGQQGQPPAIPNDPNANWETRAKYWQSQYDKTRNEIGSYEEKKPLLDWLEKNPQVLLNAQAALQQQQQPAAPVQETFPPPPEKPTPPMNFNRTEALTDPNSKSAEYLAQLDQWRDAMIEHNTAYNEWLYYDNLEKQQAFQQQLQQRTQQEQQQLQESQRVSQIAEYLQGQHGMDQASAYRFIQEMGNPRSQFNTLDNMVEFWKFKSGATTGNPMQPVFPPAQQYGNQPSQNFQQVQRAQSVPPPMGVQSGANGNGNPTFAEVFRNITKEVNGGDPFK